MEEKPILTRYTFFRSIVFWAFFLAAVYLMVWFIDISFTFVREINETYKEPVAVTTLEITQPTG